MKKILMFLISVLMLFSFSGIAGATPIIYNVNGSGSSVTLSNNTASFLGMATITGSLVYDLGATAGDLLDGETDTIDFFNLTVSGSGLAGGEYDISATLAFDLPEVGPAIGSGGGFFGTIIGVISGGTLNWDTTTLPDVFTLADGNEFSIDFESGIALGFGDTATVHATLTNNGGGVAPVPEPATILLMGVGLLGMVGIGRKRFNKKD